MFRLELANGLFGDPLVVVRLPWIPRVTLLDAGDAVALGPRTLLDVADVLVSHAHVDHVFGLARVLRARLGHRDRPLRLVGPPGLCAQVRSHFDLYSWNLVDAFPLDLAVVELHDGAAETWRLPRQGSFEPDLASRAALAPGAAVVGDELLQVRALALDHGGIPSIAYRVEERQAINIDAAALERCGLAPGPWLGSLKDAVRRGTLDGTLQLPGGSSAPVRELASQLVRVGDGDSLVYAADIGPRDDNLAALAEFARGARLLIIETHYRDAERGLAERNAHLTAADAGRVARAAGVRAVAPLHLSPRYEDAADAVLDELARAADPVPLELLA